MHVHHAPSHDSRAPIQDVVEAGFEAGLDFVVLTDHVRVSRPGPIPGAEWAGRHVHPDGRVLLVLVGAEYGTREGHLLALGVPGVVPAEGRPAREVIDAIHRDGGFAVVPHPFHYGGWRDWDAPFDGIEVHNNAAAFRDALGPLLPLRLARFALDRRRELRRMLVRDRCALELWEALLGQGRGVVGLSGADAHQNLTILGWQLDPYAQMFRAVQTRCPDGPLEAAALWRALREGRCWIRYEIHAEREAEARDVRFPSGRLERTLDGGRLVLEIHNPAGR